MKRYITIVTLFTIGLSAYSQQSPLIIQSHIRLPSDTNIKKALIHSLNVFLDECKKPFDQNSQILPEDRLEAAALIDEMKSAEKNEKLKNDHFYKAYLSNVARLNDSTYRLQLSYMGHIDTVPQLKAMYTLLARKKGSSFFFASPLKLNTHYWKVTAIGRFRFHYKDTINFANAAKYIDMVNRFDQKLNATMVPIDYYSCDYAGEASGLLGIDYHSDYNGYKSISFSGKTSAGQINVNAVFGSGFKDVDPHDLWHSRLYKVLDNSLINRPVDEGTAYLYGGSWGLSWEQILEKFKIYAKAHPDADWLTLYNESKNFDEGAQYPLNVDFLINALIIQKLEKEKGMSAVMELLACGKKTKDNENYFAALEKITGIKKSKFNQEIGKLIKAALGR